MLVTSIPEKSGAFMNFVDTVGPDLNITEFKYRLSDSAVDAGMQAQVLYSISCVPHIQYCTHIGLLRTENMGLAVGWIRILSLIHI